MTEITPAGKALILGPDVIPSNLFSMNSRQLLHCFGYAMLYT